MKDDIRRFRAVCNRNKLSVQQRHDFSDYIHQLKDSGNLGSGNRGDFTFHELDELAQEFLRERHD